MPPLSSKSSLFLSLLFNNPILHRRVKHIFLLSIATTLQCHCFCNEIKFVYEYCYLKVIFNGFHFLDAGEVLLPKKDCPFLPSHFKLATAHAYKSCNHAHQSSQCYICKTAICSITSESPTALCHR